MSKRVIVDIITAALFGVLFVVNEIGFGAIAFVTWGVLLIETARRDRARTGRFGLWRIATQMTVMVMIVVAAVLAPGKHIDRLLQETVSLPKKDTTLEELLELSHSSAPEVIFPLRVSFVENPPTPAKRLTFPSAEMSLRDFIQTIEQQTNLRSSFYGCGNAYSVLRGPAHFGISFYRPSPWE